MVLRVAIGGFGAIGKAVAEALDPGKAGGIEGLSLAAVAARDAARAEAAMAAFAHPVPVLPLDRLWEAADIVIECAPAAHLRDIAEPALANGRTLVTLSCGALLDNFDLVELARRHGGRILVPTGALLALDAVQAAALGGGIRSVRMITRKPPGGLDGAPYLVEQQIRVTGLTAAKLVFTGSARRLARAAGEYQLRRGESGDADLLLDEVRRAVETAGRLAGDHPHRSDAAAQCRRLHRVERQERSGRHQDAAAVPPRQLDEVEIVEQRPAAQRDEGATVGERRFGDVAQMRRRRAFDDDVGRFPEAIERQHRHGMGEGGHRRFRPRRVAGRDRGEAEALYAASFARI